MKEDGIATFEDLRVCDSSVRHVNFVRDGNKAGGTRRRGRWSVELDLARDCSEEKDSP